MAYADVHLGVFDCSSLIGRAFFDQQRGPTESGIIREGTGSDRDFQGLSALH